MPNFARGKYSLYICDKLGTAHPLSEMRMQWDGLFVHRSAWDPKHPQIKPKQVKADPQAIRNARPDRTEPYLVFVCVPLWNAPNNRSPRGIGKAGSVTVSTP